MVLQRFISQARTKNCQIFLLRDVKEVRKNILSLTQIKEVIVKITFTINNNLKREFYFVICKISY